MEVEDKIPENYKIALIGFDQDVTSKLEDILQQCDLPLEVAYRELVEDIKNFHVNFSQEPDIIIISSMGFKDNPADVISKIKQRYPLSEQILIVFKLALPLAINAFRSGVRDIVEFPLEISELKASLDRAITYRSLYKHSETVGRILSMLTLWGNYRQFNSKKEFFAALKHHLFDNFYTENFEIVNVDAEKNVHSIWSEHDGKISSSGHFDKTLTSFLHEQVPHDLVRLHWIESTKSFLLGFWLGKHHDLSYWCFFETPNFPKEIFVMDYAHHFIKVVRNAFYYQLSFEEKRILTSLSRTDDVTGLYNQRRLHIDIDQLVKIHKENDEPFTILFMDIDHFKAFRQIR